MVKMWAMMMVLFVLNLANNHGVSAKPQVPCYFIFGDSLVDNGNNNELVSLAKANFFPYGIDFPQGATGRFCNGKTTVDVITELLGFDDYVSSYAKQRRQDVLKFRGMNYVSAAAAQLLDLVDIIKTYVGFHHNILKGVNYGSGAAGILDDSGKTQGDRISMNEQLIHHKKIVRRIALLLGGKRAAEKYLNRCLYSVTMGSNDYVNNYYLPQAFDSSDLYSPEQFAGVLIQQYSLQLQTLYKYGARKVVVFGVGQIGFTPIEISQHGTEYPTVYDMNDAAILFNVKLKALVEDFNLNLPGAKFTFISDPGVVADESLGFTEIITPCCVVGNNNDTCAPNTIPCENRKEYVFFDNIHPSEALNIYFGNAYYNATTTDAYPYTIAQLAQL